MVYLAAWGKRSAVPKKQKQRNLILTQFLWYPELPDSGAYINESCIFGNMESSIKGFRPVVCSSFGGPGGIDLQHLISVCVTINYGCLVNVGFEYKSDSSCCPGRMLSRNHTGIDILFVEINGPKGEYIEKIEVEALKCDPDVISGLRVCTLSDIPTTLTN